MHNRSFQHWQFKIDDENIAWLAFDRYDKAVNTINRESLSELNDILMTIAKNPSLKGLIIYSAKEKGFIAGADINDLQTLQNKQQVKEFLQQGHDVFNKLAALTLPTVALIKGFCLGGGLELALACRYRIALAAEDTRIGLPEVKLGIYPGWGGTIRLPQLIGAAKALDLILKGRIVTAKQAKKYGLVDDAVPIRHFEQAARYYIRQQPQAHQPTFLQKVINIQPLRSFYAYLVEKQIAKKIRREHYPNFYIVVENWQKYGAHGKKAYEAEITALADLVEQSETPQNLFRVFHLQERLKSLAKEVKFKAQRIHIIGAGIMGGDLAAWCALQGLYVTLQDRDEHALATAIQRAYQLFKNKLFEERLIEEAIDRLIPDMQGQGIAKADIVVEAIVEKLAAKQQLFKEIEAKVSADAILATNTSSIPLDDINRVMQNPERLVGIHFFNPIAKMQLVEIVKGNKTSPQVVDQAIAFVHQIDRLPLPVKSSPGFLVNRVLMPYLMECMVMLQEGIPAEVIDESAKEFGMPMGPVELADTVGLDICLSVAENLTSYFGGNIPDELREKVKRGELGRKTGKGFYEYKKGEPVKSTPIPATISRQALAERLILRLVNEAVACLREGIVSDEDLLDSGMILGAGFAPFRGGPMHYARCFGRDKLQQLFSQLESTYGERFKADSQWRVLQEVH